MSATDRSSCWRACRSSPSSRRRSSSASPGSPCPARFPPGRGSSTRATTPTPATSSARATCGSPASTPTGGRSRSPRSAPATSSASWRCSTARRARPASRRSRDAELLALPAADVRRLLADHPEITVKLVARADPAPARDQRADLPPVLPDRAQPGRRRAHPADRRGGGRRGAAGRHDPHDPGRPRPARGHLARERQPLPRRRSSAPASFGSAAAGSPCSSPGASTPTSSDAARRRPAATSPPARADGRAPAAPPGDRRRAGAGGDGRGARASASCPSGYRRRAYADSALPIGDEPDDLPALDRGGDLPGAGARRAIRAGARGRDRLGLLGGGARSAGRAR